MFDGLETLFAQNLVASCNALLKAINNRKYIYFVTLKLDYNVLKEQEKKAQEEKGLFVKLHYVSQLLLCALVSIETFSHIQLQLLS